MDEARLEYYWNDLPVGRNNAAVYQTLCDLWGKKERVVRSILHELSLYDNGDDYVLIRSGASKGFYKTDDKDDIAAYRRECLAKGRSVFAPVKKCNRILNTDTDQLCLFNNLRVRREAAGMKQSTVCRKMRKCDAAMDTAMLSKMENGRCLPTPYQLSKLAEIYGCEPSELVKAYSYL